jgi:hypothetical protein
MKTQTFEMTNRLARNKTCNHESLIQEFAYGAATGNYICIHCECLIPAKVLSEQRDEMPVMQFQKTSAYSNYIIGGI